MSVWTEKSASEISQEGIECDGKRVPHIPFMCFLPFSEIRANFKAEPNCTCCTNNFVAEAGNIYRTESLILSLFINGKCRWTVKEALRFPPVEKLRSKLIAPSKAMTPCLLSDCCRRCNAPKSTGYPQGSDEGRTNLINLFFR